MEGDSIRDNISKYFDSATLSDVIIRCDSEEIKAHRLVLASGSQYFKGCLNEDFKEANTGVIELKEDKLATIKGLIAFLYGLYYDGEHGLSSEVVTLLDASMEYLVDLDVTAQKYLVYKLSNDIDTEVRCRLENAEDVADDSGILPYAEEIDELVRYLKGTYPDHDPDYWPDVVELFAKYSAEWEQEEEFKKLLAEVPALAFDVLQKLAKDKAKAEKKAKGKGR